MLTCLQLRRFDLVISHIIFSSEVWRKKTTWKICYFVRASAQEGCTGAVCRETHLPRRLKGTNRRPPRRRRAAARSEGDGGAGKPSEHRFACVPSVGGLAETSKARPAQVSSLAEAHPLVRLPAVSLPPRTSRASRKHIRPHRPSPRKRARADYPCESASSHTQKGSPRSHERRRRARPRLDPRESASARTAGRILPTREKGARKLGLPHYLVWPNSLYRSRCPDSHQPPYLYWLSCLRKKSKRGGSSWMRWAPASISMAGHSSSLESKS